MNVLVTGAGGFIGGWLVNRLLEEGHLVRAVDIKAREKWWQYFGAAENVTADLRWRIMCDSICDDIEYVYNLAASMGGIGFIENNKAACMLNVLISTHMLRAAQNAGVKRFFYSSSACVYAAPRQDRPWQPALREEEAYPAMPEDGYGWEKLFSERMCRHFREDYGLETRVARLHNVMGPHGSWNDGREKAPAAICRKVAEAKLNGDNIIDIWGDGRQTRSFMWIEDCIEGIRRLMDSDIADPINIGSAERVTVNELVNIVEDIAGVKLGRRYDRTKPQGVSGRSSDNSFIKAALKWEPTTSLRTGLERLYPWIEQQVKTERETGNA